jgi:glyoxylase-like metal-dependent hydrolase (beta-lactamase superfamily II)
METVIPNLHASAPERLPFAPSLEVRAFLLQRPRGNILIYSVAGLGAEAAEIERLGGIGRRYLSHRHEAMFASGGDAPLFVHEEERPSVETADHVRATFSRRHLLDDDFEVIPIPGHTRGATAFLWDSGRHRVLFSGDTIYLDRGVWAAALLESSDPDSYAESLELIRELEFDVLVPWAATAGRPFHAFTWPADTRRRIDSLLAEIGNAHGTVAEAASG